jgi:hypothetical protein
MHNFVIFAFKMTTHAVQNVKHVQCGLVPMITCQSCMMKFGKTTSIVSVETLRTLLATLHTKIIHVHLCECYHHLFFVAVLTCFCPSGPSTGHLLSFIYLFTFYVSLTGYKKPNRNGTMSHMNIHNK